MNMWDKSILWAKANCLDVPFRPISCPQQFLRTSRYGKTALAKVIASTTAAEFIQLNAVSASISDIRKIIEEAGERLGMWQKKTILFIDEITVSIKPSKMHCCRP